MSRYGYVSSDVIISKHIRDIKDEDIDEADIIEWIGEAMGFMKQVSVQEEALSFLEVKNHAAEKPCGMQTIIQVARDNDFNKSCNYITAAKKTGKGVDIPCELKEGVPMDCQGNLIGEYDIAYYRPYFDLKYEYEGWINSSLYRNRFTPVTLSNHTFFNSLVAKENTPGLYTSSKDEYSLRGKYPNLNMTFSFREGFVAVAYLRNALDPETGYPLIPDDMSFISAISYYIRWKIAEGLLWQGREGASTLVSYNEERWLKYVKQANNKAKMPHGVDEHYQLMKNSLYLIPELNRPDRFFGENIADNYGRRKGRY